MASVNNAGIAGATAPVTDYPLDTWHAVICVNLTGTFMVTQRAIPLLKESPVGFIIVMSSLAGRFGYPNRVAYSTTKWGLVGFTPPDNGHEHAAGRPVQRGHSPGSAYRWSSPAASGW